MKNIIIISLLFFSTFAFGQKEKLIGNWLITHVKTPQKAQEVYMPVEFTKEGKLIIRDFEFANWQMDGKHLMMQSEVKKSFSGKRKIIELNDQEMILKKDADTIYYVRYNPKTINDNEVYKKLTGVWKIKTNDETNYLYFKPNGDFVMLTTGQEINMTTKGKWYYLDSEKALIIKSDVNILRGKSNLLHVDDKHLSLEQNGKTFQAIKLRKSAQPQLLEFSQNDFSNEIDDTDKLPWKDNQQLLKQFNSINKLQYLQYNYSADIESFITKDIVWDCSVDLQENSIRIVISEILNDKKNQLEIRSKDNMTNRYNHFFPEKDIQPFKVLSIDEKITVPAGTYSCTLVEGIDGNTKYKYWMINNKPGIYAKIIKQSKDMFENISYQVIELNKI